MNQIKLIGSVLLFVVFAGLQIPSASAQMEFQYQRGNLLNPFTGKFHGTNILTFQHAGGWKLGGTFFFIDFSDDGEADGFNDLDFYGEWYPTLSFSKLIGQQVKLGPIADISFLGGVNYGGDANIFKLLPGVQLSWKIPGFIFVNTDFSTILDYSGLKFKNGFMFDISWLKVMNLGNQTFSFMGHAEYIAAVSGDGHSGSSEAWVLAQPQLVWDLGKAFNAPNMLHVGIEIQFWRNKLGVKDQNEFRPELLIIWRMQ